MSCGEIKDFVSFVCYIVGFVKPLSIFIMSAAMLVFFWGVARFVLASGDASKVKEGRVFMAWGIIGLFVMVSLWGIVKFVQTTLHPFTGDTRTGGVDTKIESLFPKL